MLTGWVAITVTPNAYVLLFWDKANSKEPGNGGARFGSKGFRDSQSVFQRQ